MEKVIWHDKRQPGADSDTDRILADVGMAVVGWYSVGDIVAAELPDGSAERT